MDFSSKLLENAVQEIAQLPGIGKRTALRLALHLLKQPVDHTLMLTSAISSFREGVIFCERCHNLSDAPLCEICASLKRNKRLLCVVEDIRDVMAIENTGQYNGLYHVLGGIISPMDGVGPKDLTIDSLIEKVKNENGGTEYHVIDQGIIHAFYSLEEAKDYVDFAKNECKERERTVPADTVNAGGAKPSVHA